MSSAHQLLPLSQVVPGMLLSDQLLDRQGQVLLPQGAVLSAATIALLPGHGVEAVPVQLDPVDQPAAVAPGVIEQRLAHLFRKNDPEDEGDWATGLLRRYVEDYRLGRGVAP